MNKSTLPKKPRGGVEAYTHSDLVEIARRWLCGRYPVVVTDTASSNQETPDAIGWDASFSVLIECKATRSDFLSDKKKIFRQFPENGMGDYRYYMTPAGLITVDELPQGWGLLEVRAGKVYTTRTGKGEHRAPLFRGNKHAETTLLISAMRRLKIDPTDLVSVRVYLHDTKRRGSISVATETEV